MRYLYLGGSKSGKSMQAQTLARDLALGEGLKLYYWATMEPSDEEDRARIRRHLADRDGWGFTTVEQGRDLPEALDQVDPDSAVLFDSVTAVLSNEMFLGPLREPEELPAIAEKTAEELLEISRKPAHFICVCDDIFRDGGRYDPWTEGYRQGLARICRILAAEFDVVCEVSGGLPHLHKPAETSVR